MRYYDRYKHLLGIPYDDGDRDCYGLARRFYIDNYGIHLPNYARSWTFFGEGIDLTKVFLRETDFTVVDVAPRRLEVGDGLLMSVSTRDWPRDRVNHIGVFVGNGTILHHPLGKKSCEDYIDELWASRILSVVRHPDVAALNAEAESVSKVNFLDLVPEHAKRKLSQESPGLLEPNSGAGGSGTQRLGDR